MVPNTGGESFHTSEMINSRTQFHEAKRKQLKLIIKFKIVYLQNVRDQREVANKVQIPLKEAL